MFSAKSFGCPRGASATRWRADPLLIGMGVAGVPALQARLMDVAEDAQTTAAALNHSAFNIANALGAWLGGSVIALGLGWASTGWVGALLAESRRQATSARTRGFQIPVSS